MKLLIEYGNEETEVDATEVHWSEATLGFTARGSIPEEFSDFPFVLDGEKYSVIIDQPTTLLWEEGELLGFKLNPQTSKAVQKNTPKKLPTAREVESEADQKPLKL